MAKSKIEAREKALDRFKEYWYVNSKKIGTYLFQVELERRRVLKETLYIAEFTALCSNMKELVKEVAEPIEIENFNKDIDDLYKGVVNLVINKKR